MKSYVVTLDESLAQELEESFNQGPMLNEQGSRSLNEEQIARIGGLSVQIQSDEHPPPHFHVRFAGENASFSISDGTRLPGVQGLEKYEKNIKFWWKSHRCDLIHAWNRLRPADCPVGVVSVPPECKQPIDTDADPNAE